MNNFRNYFTLTLPRCKICNVIVGRKQGSLCDKCKVDEKEDKIKDIK